MRTKRKTTSLELLCGACDKPYAEVYPDRFIIYSFHDGNTHTSGFALEDFEQVHAVALSGRYLKLPCSCNQSHRPCAVIQSHRLTITIKHKAQPWQPHMNVLTLDEIEDICRMLGRVDVILPDELDAPDQSVA